MIKLVLKLSCVAVLAAGIIATNTERSSASANCGACILMNDDSHTCQHCGHLGLTGCEPAGDHCDSTGQQCDADPSGRLQCFYGD